MQPATVNITLYKGSTYSKDIQWMSGDPATAVNLTGCTARMQVRRSASDTNVLDELTTQNGRLQITLPLEGKIRINFPANVSTNYNFTTALYDLEVVFGGSEANVYRIIQGTITTNPEITK